MALGGFFMPRDEGKNSQYQYGTDASADGRFGQCHIAGVQQCEKGSDGQRIDGKEHRGLEQVAGENHGEPDHNQKKQQDDVNQVFDDDAPLSRFSPHRPALCRQSWRPARSHAMPWVW